MNDSHRNPTHPDPDLLAALAEGEPLPAGTTADLEAHLSGCASCQEEVAWIRKLRQEAAGLPREVTPPPGLFPAIRSRIEDGGEDRVEDRVEAGAGTPVRLLHPRAPRYPVAWLAAAAVLLVALSSALTLQLARETLPGAAAPHPVPGAGGATAGGGETPPEPATHLASSGGQMQGILEAAWGPTLATLEAALLHGRDQLHPETLEVVESSLRTIDEALAEARAALEADPGNPEAARALNGAYESRAQLLRQATSLLPGA